MLVRTATTLALLLASLPAQQGKPDLRETLDGQLLETLLPKLASDEPRDVAWGAHLVGHYRLAGAAESLRAALRRFRDEQGQPARQVRLHLIDALLLLEVQLPADEFVFLLDDPLTRVPAFLCAAFDVQGHAELLAGLVQTGVGKYDLVPFAAGGLLVDEPRLGRKPAAFTRHLLTLARAELSVRVEDAKSTSGPWNSAVGVGRKEPQYAIQRGFPRMPHHTLKLEAGIRTSTTHVLRSGSRATHELWREDPDGVSRSVPESPGGRCDDWGVSHARELVRSIPTANLTAEPDPQPLEPRAATRWLERMARHALPSRGIFTEITFTDVASLQKDVQRLHAELRACGNGLIENLIAAGWLPKDEPTTFVLPVDASVHDDRGDRTMALPSVAELLGPDSPSPQTTPR